jgi:Zn-dependent oligopeptidase
LRRRPRPGFNAAYQAAYRAYGVQVERGASLSKRLELLNTLLRKFEGKGIDLSAARTEHERVKSNLAQVSSDFRITLDFYKKTVAQGADATERISLLERMLKKYQKSGIDLSEVRDELNRLKQP